MNTFSKYTVCVGCCYSCVGIFVSWTLKRVYVYEKFKLCICLWQSLVILSWPVQPTWCENSIANSLFSSWMLVFLCLLMCIMLFCYIGGGGGGGIFFFFFTKRLILSWLTARKKQFIFLSRFCLLCNCPVLWRGENVKGQLYCVLIWTAFCYQFQASQKS